ncbi:MAG TPA: TolC family protein [Ginsengibacter sp.]|nr:TolC family protein [Agriterribacter sp.]HRP43265.1 TolC family protein [Ginsengibacter sp.]
MKTYQSIIQFWKYYLFFLFTFISVAANAQEQNSSPEDIWTLERILDSIEVQNAGLQQFALKTNASNKQAEAVKAWDAPSIGVGLSEFPYNVPKGMEAREMPMIRVQQMFPNFARQKNQKAYFESFSQLNKNDRETMKNQLFFQAKNTFTEAYIAEKKLAVLNQQEKQIQLLLKIAEGRLQYGKADLPNIYKIRAKLSDLKSQRIKIESVVGQSSAILNSLMNRPLGQPLKIDTLADPVANRINILSIDSGYIQNHRSDIQRISNEIETDKLQQKSILSKSKPTFGITLDNMRMAGGMYMYNVMAMVTIPIAPWSKKGYKNEAQSLDYEIRAKQKDFEDKVQQTLGAVRKQQLEIQTAEQDLNIFKTEVIPAYQKTLQANLDALGENQGNIYETLTAWEDLTMKEFEYYEKLSDLIKSKIELQAAIQQY